MKYILIFFLMILPSWAFAKTGYENIVTFNSKGWTSQKTPTGLGMICIKCENQVMISIDVVPVNKSNKYAKSNSDFISYLMSDKDNLARTLANDTVAGGKIKLIKADKAKIKDKDVFQYMFIADTGFSKTFDNTSMLIHKKHLIKITLNYFNGFFSPQDKYQVDSFYKSINFTP